MNAFSVTLSSLVKLLILLTFYQLSCAAEVYVWTDDSGKKHFSDVPPETHEGNVSRESFDVHNVDSGYPYTDPELYKNQTETWSEKKKKEREVKEQEAKQRQVALEVPCKKARQRLAMMEGPVTFHDNSGAQIKTTERERQEAVSQLRDEIDRDCR